MIIQVMNNILMMSLRFDFFIDVKTKKRGGQLTHIFFFFGVVKRIPTWLISHFLIAADYG